MLRRGSPSGISWNGKAPGRGGSGGGDGGRRVELGERDGGVGEGEGEGRRCMGEGGGDGDQARGMDGEGSSGLVALMELVGIGGGEGRDRLRTGDGEGEVFHLDRVVTPKRVLVCVLSESAVLPLGVGTTTGRAGLAKYLLDAWRGVVIPSEFFPNPVPTMCP
ncbi:hypothetical protein M0802_015988 [Mischocyttarus mexicanus]|nr:hypothetical protein M0802_015988 [Mischocyttarus mexicanus]